MSKGSKELFKENKFGIRKFTIGVASIMIGTTFYIGANHEAKADELSENQQSQQDSNNINDKDDTQVQQNTNEQAKQEVQLKDNQTEQSQHAELDKVNDTQSTQESANKTQQNESKEIQTQS